MKPTSGAVERDLAAMIKHSHDLRDESAELNRTAVELAKKAARLGGVGETEVADAARAAMSDDTYTANRPPTPPWQPQTGERLFEFLRGHDQFLRELLDDGPEGFEARFFQNEDLLFTRRFATRALAVQWAEQERKGD